MLILTYFTGLCIAETRPFTRIEVHLGHDHSAQELDVLLGSS